MNKQRRNKLKDANNFLNRAIEIILFVKEEEQNSLDNIPENLEMSERYQKMETAIEYLDNAEDSIGEAIENLNAALE